MKVKDLTKTKLFQNFTAVTKAAEDKPRTLVVKITSPTPDRSKDVVVPDGMMADNYMKNPVVQFAHDYYGLPIAKCIGLKVVDTGILAEVEFPQEGVYDKADLVYWMYQNNYLSAWSIGFQPHEYEENEAGGYLFKKWELMEFSSVPVPDNPEALTIVRSKGFNPDILNDKGEDKDKKEPEKKEEKTPEAVVEVVSDIKAEVTVKIAEAEVVIKTLDEAQKLLEQLAAENTELKVQLKTGRTLSAKHEGLLATARDNIQTVLDTVEEAEPDDGDKTISPGYLRKLSDSLKESDKSVGLTLRLLNQIKREAKGGEK